MVALSDSETNLTMDDDVTPRSADPESDPEPQIRRIASNFLNKSRLVDVKTISAPI